MRESVQTSSSMVCDLAMTNSVFRYFSMKSMKIRQKLESQSVALPTLSKNRLISMTNCKIFTDLELNKIWLVNFLCA